MTAEERQNGRTGINQITAQTLSLRLVLSASPDKTTVLSSPAVLSAQNRLALLEQLSVFRSTTKKILKLSAWSLLEGCFLSVARQTHLVIHNNHSAGEEIMVGDDASEPLGGRVLSVHSHPVTI